MEQDPLGFTPKASNLYSYELNSPLEHVDSAGLAPRKLQPCEVCLVTILNGGVSNITPKQLSNLVGTTTVDVTNNVINLPRAIGGILGALAAAELQALVNIAVATGAGAITLPPTLTSGGTVIVSTKPLMPCNGTSVKDLNQLGLMGHELQHAVQIATSGDGKGNPWLSQYLNAYIANLINRGMKPKRAYECIPAEIEAYAFENALLTILRDPNNLNTFNNACRCLTDKQKFNVNDLVNQLKTEFAKQKDLLTAACKKDATGKGTR
jgi:hypothetical protein